MGGQPSRCGPDAQRDHSGNGDSDQLDAPQEIPNRLGVVRAAGKASHLPTQGRLHAHIEERQPGLQHGEDTDQSISLDPEVLDVERNKNQPHQGLPALAEAVGDDVFLQRHCGGPDP